MVKHKLGVFGDSFSDAPNSEDVISIPWPVTLTNNIDSESLFMGKSCTSIWWSYKKFLECYSNLDIVIFGYSQHNRWHTLPKEYEDMHHIIIPDKFKPVPNSNPEKEKVANILYEAHRYVTSEDFDIFVFQTIFNNVNRMCEEKNIKIINLLPFEDGSMIIDYSLRKGPVIYNIQNLTRIETSKFSKLELLAFTNMISTCDLRQCHLNEYHNNLLATLISEQIESNDKPMINICKDHRVSSDPKNSYYYLKKILKNEI